MILVPRDVAAGQREIATELTTLVRAADQTQIIKYVVKNAPARRCEHHGLSWAALLAAPGFSRTRPGPGPV